MSVRVKNILKLWKAALQTVFSASKVNASFRVGLTLQKDRVAEYKNNEGIEEYLINPECKLWDADKTEKLFTLLVTACHEVTHRSHSYHGEEFVLKQEELITASLTYIKGDVNALTRLSKFINL